ncbi:histidine kinase [Psychrobacter sp. 16-MNA-CIBAN-0192]|uniref:histidine kinase n=1 Tax=Psychrobacter sp. 16-MNA-CIBAN-0192 TaxID=3140448 RepID=UPI00331E4C10
MKNWRSYRSKTSQENKDLSIAKDEVALLAERLEFFVPKLMEMMRPWQWILYIFFWSLFVTIINRQDLATWSDFLIKFASRIVQNVATILPALYLIDYMRPTFRHENVVKVSLRILLLLTIGSAVSVTLIMLIMINAGWIEYNSQVFLNNVLFNVLITGGFTFVFLLYFLRRHRELMILKQSFEDKLTAQNDIMKSRISPHFFFNIINSLASLTETEPARAAILLQHISALFRASFDGAREISFEEEVALCEHYLAIEACRLADKLVVRWQLPEEDVMYDMIITALTLQMVLEKMLLNVVERTTETITIDIVVTWQSHRVIITVTVQLPDKTFMVAHELRQQINFNIQAERLRAHFGQDADIKSTITNTQVITIIDYPLQDVGL